MKAIPFFMPVILLLVLCGITSQTTAAPEPDLAESLGKPDPVYGYPAPRWFADQEVMEIGYSFLRGVLEFSHPVGDFNPAGSGYFAAAPFDDAGIAEMQRWRAMGSRVSAYQDNLGFGLLEFKDGMEFTRLHPPPAVELMLSSRWQKALDGWP